MKREDGVASNATSLSSSGTMITKESGDAQEITFHSGEPDVEKDGSAKLVDRYGFYVSDDFHTSLLVSAQEINIPILQSDVSLHFNLGSQSREVNVSNPSNSLLASDACYYILQHMVEVSY